jgi:hypothetical protein
MLTIANFVSQREASGLVTFVNIDGDFDNGVIAHEYGHGISTRLQVVNNSNV